MWGIAFLVTKWWRSVRLICACSRVCFNRSTFGIWSRKGSQRLLIGIVAFDGAALISSGFKADGEGGRLVKSRLHPRPVADLLLPWKGRGVMPLWEKRELNSDDTDLCTEAVCMNWNLNSCLSLPKRKKFGPWWEFVRGNRAIPPELLS